MRFEWDNKKSEENEKNHGVPLSFGCQLWESRVVTFKANRNGERRRFSTGMIGGECWVVIWEDKGEARRLISVRLATTKKERSTYDRHNR